MIFTGLPFKKRLPLAIAVGISVGVLLNLMENGVISFRVYMILIWFLFIGGGIFDGYLGGRITSFSDLLEVYALGLYKTEDEREEFIKTLAGYTAFLVMMHTLALISLLSLFLAQSGSITDILFNTFLLPTLSMMLVGTISFRIALRKRGISMPTLAERLK